MELFRMEFSSALAAIVVIDLVLAGDNAIVIALVVRNLPPHRQTQEEAITIFRDDTLAVDDKAFFLKVRDMVEADEVACHIQSARGCQMEFGGIRR